MLLNDLRFNIYQTASIKLNFKLERLSLTVGVAEQHIFRAYYQLHTGLGNPKNATDCGWKMCNEGNLMPTYTTEDQLIPTTLLQTNFCSYEKGSAVCTAAAGNMI